MAALRATNIFFKQIRPRFARPIFLQNFTWLSKFHLPPVGIIQLIYRGVLKCYLKCNFINAKIPGYRTLIYRTLPDTMHFLLPPTCTVHRGTTVQCTYYIINCCKIILHFYLKLYKLCMKIILIVHENNNHFIT